MAADQRWEARSPDVCDGPAAGARSAGPRLHDGLSRSTGQSLTSRSVCVWSGAIQAIQAGSRPDSGSCSDDSRCATAVKASSQAPLRCARGNHRPVPCYRWEAWPEMIGSLFDAQPANAAQGFRQRLLQSAGAWSQVC